MKIAIINMQTNICENISADDRPLEEIHIPGPYFVIDLDSTSAIDWVWDETKQIWIAVEGMGNGGIGDVWDGSKLVAPKPGA